MRNAILLLLFLFSSLSSVVFAKVVILDVRTPEEYSKDHVAAAMNIDVKNPNFKTEVSKLSREDEYKVYCASGRRSTQAVSIMQELGFKHLENLGGLENAKKVLQ
ncbi:MAG: rhodanese-like domain-containing protein [Bdellovibrionales bacterium]|nr:rhodanese-like domain-containing protein [Bdellovibrionales bacterium]